jgi:hypothetical protein
MARRKMFYMLRVRYDDRSPWSEPTAFLTRKDRDESERLNRCLGGIRTHSYEEPQTDDAVGQPADNPT